MTIHIVTTITSKHFGLDNIPHEPSKRFDAIMKNGIMIIEHSFLNEWIKPLPNAFCVVVYPDLGCKYRYKSENILFIDPTFLDRFVEYHKDETVYVLGGAELFRKFLHTADFVHLTIVEQDIPSTSFFPINHLHAFEMSDFSEATPTHRKITYKRRDPNTHHHEHQYLDLVREITKHGKQRMDRTAVGTRALFGKSMVFDVSKYVPFITTKQLAWKSVIKELLWFISGSSNSKDLENQHVHIWKGNTSRAFLDNRGLSSYAEGDCGPMYSHSLRHFNADYKGCTTGYDKEGFDQLSNIISSLKRDPHSRRHLMTTFNPSVQDQCALMVCHGIAIQFFVGDDNDLSCCVYNRSQDIFLGSPFNIASYTCLLYIIAKLTDLCPGVLTMFSGDTHIYNNHMEQANLQLSRSPLPQPVLIVSDAIKSKGLREITLDDFELIGYLCHPSIKAEMAV